MIFQEHVSNFSKISRFGHDSLYLFFNVPIVLLYLGDYCLLFVGEGHLFGGEHVVLVEPVHQVERVVLLAHQLAVFLDQPVFGELLELPILLPTLDLLALLDEQVSLYYRLLSTRQLGVLRLVGIASRAHQKLQGFVEALLQVVSLRGSSLRGLLRGAIDLQLPYLLELDFLPVHPGEGVPLLGVDECFGLGDLGKQFEVPDGKLVGYFLTILDS